MFALVTIIMYGRAGNVEYLTFNVADNPVVIALAEHPVITYTDNTLHIKTAKETIDIPVSQLAGTIFSETTAIKNIDGSQLQMKDGSICFMNLAAESKIHVYSADGMEKLSTTVDANGQAVVNIDNLPKGVYIIKSANQTIKISNK